MAQTPRQVAALARDQTFKEFYEFELASISLESPSDNISKFVKAFKKYRKQFAETYIWRGKHLARGKREVTCSVLTVGELMEPFDILHAELRRMFANLPEVKPRSNNDKSSASRTRHVLTYEEQLFAWGLVVRQCIEDELAHVQELEDAGLHNAFYVEGRRRTTDT